MHAPTPVEIDAIEHEADLRLLLDSLDAECTKIETDLEFRPGDDDWHARARGALTAFQIARKRVGRRLNGMRPKAARAPDTGAKAQRRLAAAQLMTAQARNAEAKTERVLASRQKENEALVRQHSLSLKFMKHARRMLAPESFEEILEAASDEVAAKAQETFSASPSEETGADTQD